MTQPKPKSPGIRPPRQSRTGLTSTGARKAGSKSDRSRAREFALQALYQRLVGRNEVADFTDEKEELSIGKGQVLSQGNDITLIATGHMVWNALQACRILEEQGIHAEVINIHTIKPLDETAVLASVNKTGCVVTAEEHFRNGGLGDSIAQLLSRKLPSPIEMVAVDDEFGQSGKPEELLKKYHLDVPDVVEAVLKVMARK